MIQLQIIQVISQVLMILYVLHYPIMDLLNIVI